MRRSSESGSHLIALALAIVAVGVIGFTGYRVWQMQQAATTDTAGNTSATVPAAITNTASLNQASSALDQSSAQVSNNLDDSGLDADLSSML